MDLSQIEIPKKFVTSQVGLIGVSVKEGQQKTGVEKAPQLYRDAKLIDVMEKMGLEVIDHGDIKRSMLEEEIEAVKQETEGNKYKYQVMNGDVLGVMNRRLSEMCYRAASAKQSVVVLGGDHGLAAGSIHGMKMAYPKLKVVWVDAHGDCNVPETSPSGNYHGMPAAHLMGWMPAGSVKGFDWFTPCLKETEIVYIGLRDIDPDERDLLRKHNIKVYTPYDIIDKGGIANVMTETLAYLDADKDSSTPIHISWDVDACDPSFITATGTKARCGLTEAESHYILRRIARTGNLVSIDMVEVNPEIETNKENRTILHGDIPILEGPPSLVYACEFILSALGNKWL